MPGVAAFLRWRGQGDGVSPVQRVPVPHSNWFGRTAGGW